MAIDFLQHLRAESARLLDVATGADPKTSVPSCPEWDVADLVWHIGEVQWFWASVVEQRLQSPEGLARPERPGTVRGLLGFAAEQAERLHAVLSETDPATSVYMWAEDKTVGYIRRRQAHEALIHRLDAELAAGSVTPLDAELAADGVEEALAVMYGGCPPWGTFTPSAGARLAVTATDADLSVPVALGRFTGTDPDGTSHDEPDLSVRFADPAAEPGATVRGRAEDLDAWLWRRRGRERLEVGGDVVLVDHLEGVISAGIG